jgi:hypothetical protein
MAGSAYLYFYFGADAFVQCGAVRLSAGGLLLERDSILSLLNPEGDGESYFEGVNGK